MLEHSSWRPNRSQTISDQIEWTSAACTECPACCRSPKFDQTESETYLIVFVAKELEVKQIGLVSRVRSSRFNHGHDLQSSQHYDTEVNQHLPWELIYSEKELWISKRRGLLYLVYLESGPILILSINGIWSASCEIMLFVIMLCLMLSPFSSLFSSSGCSASFLNDDLFSFGCDCINLVLILD